MNRLAVLALSGALLPLVFPAAAATPHQHRRTAQASTHKAAESPAQPQRLGESQGWTSYTAPEKKGEICYIVGQPSKSEPANVKRDPIHLLVTHNTADKTYNVVSFIAGYGFKDGSDATLDISGKKFDLFTKEDTAWARDSATDKAIVEAMIKGRQAVIKGSSTRGTATTDVYNLAGFAQAIQQIDKACHAKR